MLVAGRYRLEAPLGRGGFGEVWKAVDTHRGMRVALKLLSSTRPEAAWREASLLSALSCDQILHVNNADISVDVPYLATDLARGSLDAESVPFGMEPSAAVGAMRRALTGLQLCHSARVLHRDIKPANIFRDLSGYARLGDFGAAAILDSEGMAPCFGDLRIVAPEGFLSGMLTPASDQYSAGVTLYFLLAAVWPFPQATEDALKAAVVAGVYPPLRDLAPHVSRGLDTVIRKAMAVVPGERYASVAELNLKLGLLPKRARTIRRVAPHAGHAACWSVVTRGGGGEVNVCASPESKARFRINTQHGLSSRHIKQHCHDGVTEKGLPAKLRAVFDALRAA